MADGGYRDMLPLGPDGTDYRRLTPDPLPVADFEGEEILKVAPEALEALSAAAFSDIAHFLRPGHLQQLRDILDDPEASDNDRFVALDLLKNANVAAGGVLPMCQDTGTAIVMARKGHNVRTDGNDAAALSDGIARTYRERNLRYSNVSPLSMFEETNTGTNLPAQIEIHAAAGDAYDFLFIAKGGGSANKSFLYQQTPAILNPDSLLPFLDERIRSIGTAACPPYHLAVVIGGTSAEYTLKTVKLATTRYLDSLPTRGGDEGTGYRDLEMERRILDLARRTGIGAQFGGKYFCHDVRVIRLPRHGASVPIGLGVSCAADRQALGKITREGVFLERLETNPARFLPEVEPAELAGGVVRIDLERPMDEIRRTLGGCGIRTRLSLTGPMIVARDAAHARIKERLDAGEPMPDHFRNHAIYYAGPAKTPEGYASGSFGPTTAGRMDSYVEHFQERGGSHVMLAKGNRSPQVTASCRKHGGFYLGSIGGPGARLAQDCIRKVECVEYPELGMEAIWRIEVEDFPAFVVIDDKGNDFFAGFRPR